MRSRRVHRNEAIAGSVEGSECGGGWGQKLHFLPISHLSQKKCLISDRFGSFYTIRSLPITLSRTPRPSQRLQGVREEKKKVEKVVPSSAAMLARMSLRLSRSLFPYPLSRAGEMAASAPIDVSTEPSRSRYHDRIGLRAPDILRSSCMPSPGARIWY